ncbi:hypothetical protein [Geopseudomonas aromaticivorans]
MGAARRRNRRTPFPWQQCPDEKSPSHGRFTFEHHDSNVDFIRLVSIENIHHGVHLAQSQVIRSLNKSILAELAKILDRGVAAGIFRPGLEPRDLHLLISSFCFFRVSNRHTFATIHQVDFSEPVTRARHKEMICEVVIRYVRACAIACGMRGVPWGERQLPTQS